MANGPLGGNMGSLPIAPQPPQVNFTTTAESRGGFNDFLRSIPSTMNMIPPSNPMGGNPMPPMGGNPMDNIDIFNQPMGMMGMNQPQMNPMMQQPMQQQPMNMGMMQQPMMMEYGGNVPPRETEIRGQDHMLAYITPEEGGILKALGGAGRPGPMGIPSYWGGDVGDDAADAGTGPGGNDGNDGNDNDSNNDGTDTNESSASTDMGMDSSVSDQSATSGSNTGGDNESNNNDPDDAMSAANQAADISNTVGFSPESQANADTNTDDNNTNTDTSVTGISKGLTNVTNVGKNSNLSYSPQFSADVAQSRGLDPSVTMSPEDYSMTTQGIAAAAAQEAENMALDQATNNTNTMANQVQGISRGMSPGLATAMGTSLAQDPLGLSLDVPSNMPGFGYGNITGQGFSAKGSVPTDPTVGNVPGPASTTAANVAAQNAGNIAGVTTGPEMMGNIPGITLGSNPAPPGYEEQVGRPYSGYNINAIEDFYNAPTTMDQLGLPPGMVNSALSVVENMARDRVASDLISGNYTAITDSNGNITGSRDSFGRVHSGMDFNAPDTSPSEGGNSINPISRNTRLKVELLDMQKVE